MKHYISPMTRTDKLCCLLAVLTFFAPCFAVLAMDEVAYRAAEAADKPPVVTEADAHIDCAISYADFLLARQEAIDSVELVEEPDLLSGVPLDEGCKTALLEACEDYNVPVSLALGLIEVESNFDPFAENEVCYGLTQLNRNYWPETLTPEGNITCGISHLGDLLEQYGDTAAALCAYNAGHDTGARGYAKAVLAASEKWGNG